MTPWEDVRFGTIRCATRNEAGDVVAIPMQVPSPSPSATPDCTHTSQFCQWIFQQTGQGWLASGSYWFLVRPLQILLIVVLPVISRYLLHRVIGKLVSTTSAGSGPTSLMPREDRLPEPAACL